MWANVRIERAIGAPSQLIVRLRYPEPVPNLIITTKLSSVWLGTAEPKHLSAGETLSRSAFRRFALLAEGPAFLNLLDLVRDVRDFARCAAHVHGNRADLRPGLESHIR